MPTLKKYAEECNHITEMGVRYGFSTFALLMGKPKRLISYDIEPIEEFGLDRIELKHLAEGNGTNFDFYVGDSTKIEIEETDLLFIDTYHSYAQATAELKLHSNKVKKYIILHDTVSFGLIGNDHTSPGMIQAITDFVKEVPNWIIHEVYENNNGLTVLKRLK